ncbi:unnamed protein product [Bursaphelenchus xylophilus]|uniref:(pine wood nematode) hypothetical protein n=1 Tax=Bursaphelenchus xylophilus TaxID=6326 RepID=A0A1I7SCF9_BURXY|nr:unnamed protein product [Bursaphelenchus xylophilus]CAG9094191.1 unnamed protein product [Bursaphelenchus xylophilus]
MFSQHLWFLVNALSLGGRMNVSEQTYSEWLAQKDEPNSLRISLFLIEIVLHVGTIVTNIVFIICVSQTSTFHKNLKLMCVNNHGILVAGATIRMAIVINIISFDFFFSCQQKTYLNMIRGTLIVATKFSYLNVVAERAVATKKAARYEGSGFTSGVVILVIWWTLCGLLGIFEPLLFIVIVSLILPAISIILMEKYNKRQYHSLPQMAKSLSARYQIVENIRTLRMFRRWSYLYVVVIFLEAIMLFMNVSLVLPRGMIYEWRLISNLYDMLFVSYTLICPLFLIRAHPHLQIAFDRLLYGKTTSKRFPRDVSQKYIHHEDANAYFERLHSTWQRHMSAY